MIKKISKVINLRLCLFLVLLASIGFTSILLPSIQQRAQAFQYNNQSVKASWVDKGHIVLTDGDERVIFTDTNPSDTKLTFVSDPDGCGVSVITLSSKNTLDVASITYSFSGGDFNRLVDPNGVTCGATQTYSTLPLNNTENASKNTPSDGLPPDDNSKNIVNPYQNHKFNWRDAGAIIASGTPKYTFVSDDNGVSFTNNTASADGQACFDKITKISSDFKTASIEIRQQNLAAGSTTCAVIATFTTTIGSINNQKKEPQQEVAVDEGASCYTAGIPVISWILCPMLDLADGAYSFAKDSVSNLLFIDVSAFDGESSNTGLHSSWSIVRNLSSALLVLIALVMVASQIFSFEFMSAYTIKKVLPRLVIAAIGIQLSWFIFTTLVYITNAAGAGIYSLLTAPFNIAGGDIIDITGAFAEEAPMASAFGQSGLLVGLSALAIGGTLIITGGGMLTLVVAAIGIIISVMVAIITLVVRKMLIIVLLVLAPIALVAWILPGTQRFWDMWWKLFSRLLLMFPLIMILFAGGTIGANILANQGGASAMDYIAVIIAFFAPLFLIPSTFKFAGGMFTSIVTGLDKAGSKARGSGMFGLKEQAKADKEWVKQRRKSEAFNALGNKDIKGWRRARARVRTGTVSTAIPKTEGKRLFDERLRKATEAGESAEFDEGMKTAKNTLDTTALSGMSAPMAARELKVLAMANDGSTVKVGGKDMVVDKYLRREAISRMMETQQIGALRDVYQHQSSAAPSITGENDFREAWASVNARHYATNKAKAPDLAQDKPDALEATTAPNMLTWDDTTWEAWAKRFEDPNARVIADSQARDILKAENLRTALTPVAKRVLISLGYDPDKVATIDNPQQPISQSGTITITRDSPTSSTQTPTPTQQSGGQASSPSNTPSNPQNEPKEPPAGQYLG